MMLRLAIESAACNFLFLWNFHLILFKSLVNEAGLIYPQFEVVNCPMGTIIKDGV
jgi:hypothetical protein